MYGDGAVARRPSRQSSDARDEVRPSQPDPTADNPYATPIRQRDGSTMTYDSATIRMPAARARHRRLDGLPGTPDAARAWPLLGGPRQYVEGTGRGRSESAGLPVGASGRS